ncbi:MAG TPA: ATP-binding protein [Armatimonadota bacterium]|nr:ATP-binding protein [Armatimonadota bacterium]
MGVAPKPIVSLELGEEQVVRVLGSIDFICNGEFRSVLARAVDKGSKVTIDLSRAESLDSSAVHTLSSACKRAQALGVRFAVTGANEGILRVLQVSGLATMLGLSVLTLKSDEPEADKPDLRRQEWRITESVILADAEVIGSLRDLGLHAALESEIDDQSIAEIRVALTEALANALQHGSPEPGKSKIILRCLSCPKAFVIEVMDEGPGISQPTPDDSGSLLNEAGLGLRLMHAMMDEVEFRLSGNGGFVRMLKWLRDDYQDLEV